MKIKFFIILSIIIIKIYASNESKKRNLREGDSEIQFTMNNNIIQLQSEHVITQISWTKTDSYKYNYLLGIFEGANDPSFSDAVPIAMIKENGELQDVNIIDVNIPNSYKYIRYIPPNNNKTDISPIKLSGQLKSEINTAEKKDFQVTQLPLVSIRVENSAFPQNKEQDLNCKIVIINNGKIETNNEAATIKIRGNEN